MTEFSFLCRTSNLKPSGIYRFVLFFVLVWVMRIVSAFNYCKEMFLRNMSLWPKGLCVQSWCRAAATCSVCLFALGLSDSTVSAVVWCRMGRLLIITPELLHKLLTVRKTHFVMIHMSAAWSIILLIHAHFKWTILSLVIECSLDEAMAHWYSNACACKFV